MSNMTKFCLTWLIEKENLNTTDITLNDLNVAILNEHFYIFIAIVFTIVVGIVANVTCITVYWLSIEQSRFRTYVLFISSLDTMSCLLFMPNLIIAMLRPLDFPSEASCIVGFFVNTFTTIASSINLLQISLERVRHNFNPSKRLISQESMKVVYFFGIFFSLLGAAPNLKLMGRAHIDIADINLTAVACFTEREYINTEFANFYRATTHIAVFTLCALTLVFSSIGLVKMFFTPQFKVRQEFIINTNLRFSRNLTIMMFINTAKFCLTMMPLSILVAYRSLDESRQCVYAEGDRGLYVHVFGYLIVLSYVVDPFIYGYFDKRFHWKMKSLFYTFTQTYIGEEGDFENGEGKENLDDPKYEEMKVRSDKEAIALEEKELARYSGTPNEAKDSGKENKEEDFGKEKTEETSEKEMEVNSEKYTDACDCGKEPETENSGKERNKEDSGKEMEAKDFGKDTEADDCVKGKET